MFPAFESTIVLSREYVEDLGPLRFPWVEFNEKASGYWRSHVYVFLPVLPVAWAWYWYCYWESTLKGFVVWRWFKNRQRIISHRLYGVDDYENGYPASECVPEAERPRWRGMAVYLWRRVKRVAMERIDR